MNRPNHLEEAVDKLVEKTGYNLVYRSRKQLKQAILELIQTAVRGELENLFVKSSPKDSEATLDTKAYRQWRNIEVRLKELENE